MITEWVSSVNWGEPSILLAIVAAFACFLVPSKNITRGKRKNLNVRTVLAVVAGSGFLISGWLGILTFSITLTYLILNWFKDPKFYLYPIFSLVTFLLFSTFIVRTDPNAGQENRNGNLGGVWGTIIDTTNTVGEKAPTFFAATLVVALIIGGVFFYLRQRKRNVYRNLGLDINPDQMYNGIVNKDLRTLPESQRDPKRSFPAQMRAKKLKSQKGYCAYAHISSHPQWEPYRQGIQWEGDHVIPWAVGGATNFVNLQMLCADCNSAKSSKMFKEAERSVDKMWKEKSKQKH